MKRLTEHNDRREQGDHGDSLIMGIAFALTFAATIFLAFHALA